MLMFLGFPMFAIFTVGVLSWQHWIGSRYHQQHCLHLWHEQ